MISWEKLINFTIKNVLRLEFQAQYEELMKFFQYPDGSIIGKKVE